MNKIKLFFTMLSAVAMTASLASCSDSKSYSDLLGEETKAINNYLADQRVIGEVPADSIFITGVDAPFYRMDDDGVVYMRVINQGDKNNRPKYNDIVYMRYTRYNLKDYSDGNLGAGGGNEQEVDGNSTSFRFMNLNVNSSYNWGEAVQLPLYYLGFGCEVDLVVRSKSGPSTEIASVIPFLYHIRYNKSQI